MNNEDGSEDRVDSDALHRTAVGRPMPIEEHAVDWNGPGSPCPRLRMLLLADVDLDSAGRMVEWAIQGGTAFDLCAVCGDFVSRTGDWTAHGEPDERLSAEEGEISAILAQLENTVCRVVYVPGPLDPLIPSVRASRRRAGRPCDSMARRQGWLLADKWPRETNASILRARAASHARRAVDRGEAGSGRGGGRGFPVGMEAMNPGGRGLGKGMGGSGGSDGDGGGSGGGCDDDASMLQLQLTPTSKNLFRRTLRLAPGLLAAGFTQEVRGGGITRSRNMNNNFKSQFVATPTSTPLAGMTGGIRGGGRGLARRLSSTGGGGFSGGGSDDPAHEEDIIAFLRAVCLRPVGGLAARGRGETKGPVAKRSPPGQWSSSSSTSRASARGRAAVPSNGFATGGTADGSILPESIILLTRTGGPRPSQVGLRGGGSAISPRAVAAAFAAAASRAEGRAETEARLLHRLWAERLARGRRRGGSRPAVTSRGGEEEGGRVLLHACAGPGAARAVREALASGRRGELGAVPLALSSEEKEKPLRGEFSHGGREANGHVGDSRPGTGLEGES
ncbi:unnamed protein product, partial [Ascophyllum nodosum]